MEKELGHPVDLSEIKVILLRHFSELTGMHIIEMCIRDRSRATYEVSLKVIGQIAASQCVAKSGIMLGLGETREEILETMDDLRNVGCQVMTIGQYLQPTAKNTEVKEYIRPEVFEEYKEIGLRKGFTFVESGPLVRSSYHAERHIKK